MSHLADPFSDHHSVPFYDKHPCVMFEPAQSKAAGMLHWHDARTESSICTKDVHRKSAKRARDVQP